MDLFVTGMKQVITGSYSETATSQLLQKTGMSGQTANLIDSSFSLAGMAKAAAVMRSSQGAFVPRNSPPQVTRNKVQASASAQKVVGSGDDVLFNFARVSEKQMSKVGRKVPIQLLDHVINKPRAVIPDPRKLSSADMYYSQIWKNGKLYNIEVLYNKATNEVEHLVYTRDSMGPLIELPKVSR